MRKRYRGFCIFVGLLGGCAVLSPTIQQPTVELASIDVRDPTLTAATFVFGLRVDNPNRLRLNVRKLDYDLTLDTAPFASGELTKVGVIAPNDKTVVEVPVRIEYLRLFRSVRAMVENEKLAYHLKGKLNVSGSEVPFDLGGKLELPTGSVDSPSSGAR